MFTCGFCCSVNSNGITPIVMESVTAKLEAGDVRDQKRGYEGMPLILESR